MCLDLCFENSKRLPRDSLDSSGRSVCGQQQMRIFISKSLVLYVEKRIRGLRFHR